MTPLQANANTCGEIGTVKAVVQSGQSLIKTRNADGSVASRYLPGEEADFLGKLSLNFSVDKGIYVVETIQGSPLGGLGAGQGALLKFEFLLNSKTVLCLMNASMDELQWLDALVFNAQDGTRNSVNTVQQAISGDVSTITLFSVTFLEGTRYRIQIATSIPDIKQAKLKKSQEEDARKQFCKSQVETLNSLRTNLSQDAKKFPNFKSDYDKVLNSPVFASTCPDKVSLDAIKDEQTAITLKALSAAVSKKIVTCQKGKTRIEVTGKNPKCPKGFKTVKT